MEKEILKLEKYIDEIVGLMEDTADNTRLIKEVTNEIGIGITPPNITARLHLPAGTATAETSPLKFTSGTNLTTPEPGALEFDGTNLFITQSDGTRKTLAFV